MDGDEGASEPQPPRFRLDRTALLLDVDGTILDIAPAPDLVHVPDELVLLLSGLNKATDGALALVSGRTLHDLDALFEPLKLAAAGCHGAEVRLADGTPCPTHVPALDPLLRTRLGELVSIGEGILVEDKAYSVALHYRLAPRLGRVLLLEIERIAADFALTGIELLHGKAVIEVKSARVSKGTAVCNLIRHAQFAGRRPVFVGDDVTDQAVFDELPDLDGYGISVGRAMKGAQYCFAGAADVRAWLASLLAR